MWLYCTSNYFQFRIKETAFLKFLSCLCNVYFSLRFFWAFFTYVAFPYLGFISLHFLKLFSKKLYALCQQAKSKIFPQKRKHLRKFLSPRSVPPGRQYHQAAHILVSLKDAVKELTREPEKHKWRAAVEKVEVGTHPPADVLEPIDPGIHTAPLIPLLFFQLSSAARLFNNSHALSSCALRHPICLRNPDSNLASEFEKLAQNKERNLKENKRAASGPGLTTLAAIDLDHLFLRHQIKPFFQYFLFFVHFLHAVSQPEKKSFSRSLACCTLPSSYYAPGRPRELLFWRAAKSHHPPTHTPTFLNVRVEIMMVMACS